MDYCIRFNIYWALAHCCTVRQANEEMTVNKWWKGGLRKGDVFMSPSGKELVFIGWKHGTDPDSDGTAMCTAYRGETFTGVVTVQASDMVRHDEWMGGFMMNEGT